MNLKAYLANTNTTLKDFCKILGCSPVYLSRVMNGHAKAGKRLIKDIEALTGGQVKAEDIQSAEKSK